MEYAKTKMNRVKSWLSHRILYSGLCVCYGLALLGVPGAYGAIALLYAALAWKG